MTLLYRDADGATIAGATIYARRPAPPPRYRVLVHDFSGHPFPVQLSRELARRGHDVLHLYSECFQSPKGNLARGPVDPERLTFRGLRLERPFEKYNFLRRVPQELAYGRLAAQAMKEFAPQVVLSGNTPLDAQLVLQRECIKAGIPFIFWLQDIYGVAIDRLLAQRLPVLGPIVSFRYLTLEKQLLRRSAQVVSITDDFVPTLKEWGVPPGRIQVVENWAPIDELPTVSRDNRWAAEHGLLGKTTLLYSGTLGLKHNPDLLLQLAHRFRDRPEVRVVVVSEGLGANYLKERRAGLDNLVLLPFQPYERFPEVLGSADVLMSILEPDAGVFSVPSKVLSYLCAGRAVLASIPAENLAARILIRNEAGVVVAPSDVDGFTKAAESLVADPVKRERLAQNALDYAVQTFDIAAIGGRFEAIVRRAVTIGGWTPTP